MFFSIRTSRMAFVGFVRLVVTQIHAPHGFRQFRAFRVRNIKHNTFVFCVQKKKISRIRNIRGSQKEE